MPRAEESCRSEDPHLLGQRHVLHHVQWGWSTADILELVGHQDECIRLQLASSRLGKLSLLPFASISTDHLMHLPFV